MKSLIIFFLITFFNLVFSQTKDKNYSILHEWEYSCNIAMDSICKFSNEDFNKEYSKTKDFFQSHCKSLKIMALNGLAEKLHNSAILNRDKITYLIELYSNGYCSNYRLYILNNTDAYLFDSNCASPIVKTSTANENSLLEIFKLIKKFQPQGDSFYGVTCMITKIENGYFKSYPLLYFDSNQSEIIGNKISKKWKKI